jgi:alkylation response protein AidB-like acyl-CoA dehydrogenase
MRKTTIYGGSNEVQRNIVAQTVGWERPARCATRCAPPGPLSRRMQEINMDFDFSDDQEQLRDAVRKWVDKGYTSSAAAQDRKSRRL